MRVEYVVMYHQFSRWVTEKVFETKEAAEMYAALKGLFNCTMIEREYVPRLPAWPKEHTL